MRILFFMIVTTLWLLFCVGMSPSSYALCPAFHGSEHNQPRTAPNTGISGHRVLKVFNRNNSWLGGYRFSPGVIFQDNAGRIWLGSGQSLNHVLQMYDQTTLQWTVFGQGPSDSYSELHYHNDAIVPGHVMWICQSRDNKMWFARNRTKPEIVPEHSLVSSFDGARWEALEVRSDPKDSVNIGLFQGRKGAVWFWKNDELMNYDGKRWSAPIKLPKVIGNLAQRAQDSAARGRSDLPAYQGAIRREIITGMQDRSGYIWLGTWSQLIGFDPSRNEWREYPKITVNPELIYEDNAGRLWFADRENIDVYDKTSDSIVTYRLAHYLVGPFRDDFFIYLNAICQDDQGQMLFALSGGLLCYSQARKTWELISLRSIGLDDRINDIMKDRAGRIWIATNQGLVLLDR